MDLGEQSFLEWSVRIDQVGDGLGAIGHSLVDQGIGS